MKAAEIRSKFLKYFEAQNHTIVDSSSLVPSNDPTLLFTNAGMVQFKDVFLGKEKRPYKRATTSQKCVRAGGKHNDLENVGFTARHHTFFEMLGNFSFGDYFKKDAIHFAWEFVTKELKLPKDKLHISVFEKDDEAAEIWHQQEGVPKDRIYRFGEKDNFWAMGDTGPCGPCTELYIDRGEKFSCGKSTCKVGCDCDRYMEFWNLVFMQYDRDAKGNLNPLPKPSVDTGAGLERIAAILQNAETNYDTDLFVDIIQKTATLAKVKYDRKSELAFSFRVIADHARATTFLIGDGVLPSNEGRGYVLRRIMRRAIRHGKKLGFSGPFLHTVCAFVIDQMKVAYPYLTDQAALISKAVFAEEEQFFKTLERGLTLLDEESAKLKGSKTLPGEVVFKLYDTYGFPADLTRVIAEEKGLTVDEAGFEKSMDRQRTESRKNWKGSGDESLSANVLKLADELRSKNKLPVFLGYEKTEADGECIAVLGESNGVTQAVFSPTPFYGESGGQIGDHGKVFSLKGQPDFEAEVVDVQKPAPDLIVAHLKISKGQLGVGKRYFQIVDSETRKLTARNHTATHLLHWALREVLGKHVKQAGSIVTDELLRFDFTHFQPVTEAEITKIEDLINAKVWANDSILKREMKKDQAIAAGAIAMFGEKYGESVRVVSVGSYSTELCGGTHVDHSSDIHLFKIANESGIAAGVRRIVAYTSQGAFSYLRKRDLEIKDLRDRLKASSSEEIPLKLDRLIQGERDLRKQLEQLQSKMASGEVDEFLSKALKIRSTVLVTAECAPDASGMKRLREMVDKIKQKEPDSIMVLGIQDPTEPKVSLVVATGPKTVGFDSNALLKEIAPLIDGRGGGKADLAQAGGTKPAGLSEALAKAKTLITEKVKH